MLYTTRQARSLSDELHRNEIDTSATIVMVRQKKQLSRGDASIEPPWQLLLNYIMKILNSVDYADAPLVTVKPHQCT